VKIYTQTNVYKMLVTYRHVGALMCWCFFVV